MCLLDQFTKFDNLQEEETGYNLQESKLVYEM